jgi:hypothetical protein
VHLQTPLVLAQRIVVSAGMVEHTHAYVAVPGRDEDGFSAELETEGASNFVVQGAIFAPGYDTVSRRGL